MIPETPFSMPFVTTCDEICDGFVTTFNDEK